MRLFLSGVLALVALCRLAAAGEGGALGPGDPMGSLFRVLTDFGALGAFLVYMIWEKKRDREKRDEDSKRWYALDRELVGLVKECTLAISQSTAILTEMRVEVYRLGKTAKPVTSDTDIMLRPDATRRIPRNE